MGSKTCSYCSGKLAQTFLLKQTSPSLKGSFHAHVRAAPRWEGKPCFAADRSETVALSLAAPAERRALRILRLTDLIQLSLGTFGMSGFAET